MEGQQLRGRPGTKALPLANARAVGGPIGLRLLASYLAVGLAGWLATTIVVLIAAPDIAARATLAQHVVLATHLVTLGFLPFAVTGASFHLLPVMLRNDVRRPRLLTAALPLLGGGFLVAPAIAYDHERLLWVGAALLSAGLLLVVVELLGLVRRAPGDRRLVVSRVGVALVCVHVVAALVLGAVVFSRGFASFGGVPYERWLLVHLHLGVIGWLTLLIVTVGRTLGPDARSRTDAADTTPAARRVGAHGRPLDPARGSGLGRPSRPSSPARRWSSRPSSSSPGRCSALPGRAGSPWRHRWLTSSTGMLFLLQAAVLGFLVLAGAVSLRIRR